MLGAGDFCAAQTAGNAGLDALCAQAHGAADGLFHSAAEGNAFFQLLRNALCNQLSGQVGLFHLNDVDVNGLADHFLYLLAELVDFRAALADNHAGLRAVDVDPDFQRVALDFDARNAGSLQFLFNEITDFVIFNQDVAESGFLCKPAGIPILDYAHAKTVGINFLSHSLPPLPAYSFSFRVMVT